jgi:hypothetical protein
MAQRMTDVVLRRTGMGTNGHPGARALDEMQDLLRRELNWSDERVAERTRASGAAFREIPCTAPRTRSPARSARYEPRKSLPRLFITGGSGFIGSRLARLAVERGHAVTVVTAVNNATERARCDALEKEGITVLTAPLEDSFALARALIGHEVVIHLAAAQHEAQAGENHFHQVNVEGTRRLLELAARAGVRRFVHGSTIGVYGAVIRRGAFSMSKANWLQTIPTGAPRRWPKRWCAALKVRWRRASCASPRPTARATCVC